MTTWRVEIEVASTMSVPTLDEADAISRRDWWHAPPDRVEPPVRCDRRGSAAGAARLSSRTCRYPSNEHGLHLAMPSTPE
jgi:hypothetical protein